MNPANLFSLPGESPSGVVANREFKKDEPVLAYGGLLTDKEVAEGDSYTYGVEMPETCDPIEGLCILGNNSIGGKINDPWAPAGALKREPNLIPIIHYDDQTCTPQIIFYASRDIDKNEELLYSYGINYWKVMWREIMMAHATFTAKTTLYCKRLEDVISKKQPSSASVVSTVATVDSSDTFAS
jgi:hypothetical protein